jgi:hypothetical protein
MKLALIPLAALLAVAPFAAAGDQSLDTTIEMDLDPPARWDDLHDVDDAQLDITSRNRKVTMLLMRRVVAVQLSQRVLDRVKTKVRDAKQEDSGPLGNAIKTAVLAGVKSMLNHSAEVDIKDIAKADYRDGEIVLLDHRGRKIFTNAKVDGDTVMKNFPEPDAREFVRQLRQRMSRSR